MHRRDQASIENKFHFVGPSSSQTDIGGVGSYVDPTLFAIMGALILMFIVLCVVLQLFAK